MPDFTQEWISPILEVFKKDIIQDTYSIILGLNPIGQVLCRHFYERMQFETVLVFNSPSFSTWNRYPVEVKPPVVPVQAMVNDGLMLVFGDVFIKDYEWVTDMLFYLRGNVPIRFIFGILTHEGQTCGQVLTKKGDRLLKRMDIPIGRADFYDGLIAPLISIGGVADLDPVVIFLEEDVEKDVILQVDETTIGTDEVIRARDLIVKGLDLRLT